MAKIIPLHGTDNGVISITTLKDPYGEGSGEVVSIGISLNGDASKPDWKAHIPMQNLDEVIKVLQEIKK